MSSPVTDKSKQFYSSRPLVPKLGQAGLSSEQVRKLFYTTTTHSTFQQTNADFPCSSFSDVHKAAQRYRPVKENHAPFWSREMTRYHQTYIPLPLDGASINRELAKTFQPDEGSSSISRKSSRNLFPRTRYEEDYVGNGCCAVDQRLMSFKPKIQKHTRDDDHLLFTDSVTHELFHKLPAAKPRAASKPPMDKPTNASAGFRFSGSTRYAEEFTDLSNEGYRVQIVKGRDDSNRVKGNSIPNRVREFLYENNISAGDLPVRIEDVVKGRVSGIDNPPRVESVNPYLKDYLTLASD